VELDRYTFVLMRRGPRAAEFSDKEALELQEAHLAHLDEMAAAGKLAGAGPFSAQPDETLRGLCFYRCGIDEARELAERDPAVQAGRMSVDVFTWWTKKGSVSFQRG
jgi:uncharacterized protein YciI